ncbi:nucleotide exchange factor GrpE [Paramuribaculum intestinale]|jgi:molecular chaperone GrpE|uniref:Protein GrpE n=3 Tax=Paramuribaculum intestinale TaxID=2094151 RepID=A0A2V1J3J6_9BACT|nr:nucleotide exchange factor GrpE [Paramuribaculum intestinale]MBJ2186548.1 nucleotide exchange factor GrpE [Muribaculaceae bacterium]MDE6524008.1 nucleotide exchange factor GrpE [Paramuribaculum sp.]ROS94038.1 nucleotide exchange factor GrpE [Muribaculaceae bacterium Isolate-043 (Harlan)]ROT15131.1 nucleotide exchange factor GrpE [Muribaculaceae bacterium Isolate-105 (HZI)]RXE61799.1 nucleotide exchange factor GrpE [Muribaculaceae bacterium Isolate-004 (NCI)]
MSDKKKSSDKADGMQSEEILDNIGESVEETENMSDQDIENAEMSEIDKLAKELAEEKLKVEKEKKEYLFLMAEFDNFRKRTLKEKSDIIRNANEQSMKGLLPIVDDFERGLDATKDVDDPNAIREGMEIIYNKLVKYLEQNGVKAMESNGADFDPDMHEAIAMVPVEDQNLKGKVIDTPTKGYTINDKVLRHAKVAVGQ